MKGTELREVPIPLIEEPGHQLRERISEEGLEELKSSMAKRGLMQPIKLRRKGERYEIIYGHRRYLAACELRWMKIPAIVVDEGDADTFLDAVHENLHHEDMTPMEEARAAKALMDREGKTLKEVAKMFSKSESWVLARLDLLDMPKELKEAVEVGALSIAAVRELARITDDDARAYYLEYAIKQGATAQLCQFWRGRWEVERVKPSAVAQGEGSQVFQPPPLEVELHCQWCEGSFPISLLNHLRFCPKCTLQLHDARQIAKQEALEESRRSVAVGPAV